MRTRSFISFLALACLLGGCRERDTNDTARQLLEEMEPYLLEKYGPLNGEAYLKFFGGYDPAQRYLGFMFPVSSLENVIAAINRRPGPHGEFLRGAIQYSAGDGRELAVGFARDDERLRAVDGVLSGGRAQWIMPAANVPASDYLLTQNSAVTLNAGVLGFFQNLLLRGKWAIAQGRPLESVEWFDRAGRLGNSLFDGRSACGALAATACLDLSLDGYQTLIWSDAPPEVARVALQRLSELEAGLPDAPIRDARRLQMLQRVSGLEGEFADAEMSWAEAIHSLPDSFETFDDKTAGGNNARGADRALRTHLTRLSRRLKKQPAAYRHQLTMTPALAKRFKEGIPHLPEFQRDIGLTPKELAQLPTKAKLALAPDYLSFHDTDYFDAHLAVARERIRHVRLALAARLYRVETGRDPRSPADLTPRYLPAVPASEFGRFEFRRIDDRVFWAHALGNRINLDRVYSIFKPNSGHSMTIQVNYSAPLTVKIRHNEWDKWDKESVRILLDRLEAALKGYSALVESVERRETVTSQNTSQAEFVARFRPNLNPLVVVSPGPSRQPVSAGPPAVYDSAKGALSPGALVTLVHF